MDYVSDALFPEPLSQKRKIFYADYGKLFLYEKRFLIRNSILDDGVFIFSECWFNNNVVSIIFMNISFSANFYCSFCVTVM
jgi:hypothetical protein